MTLDLAIFRCVADRDPGEKDKTFPNRWLRIIFYLFFRQNLNSDFTDSALGSSEKSPLPYGNFQLRESTVHSIINHPRYGPKYVMLVVIFGFDFSYFRPGLRLVQTCTRTLNLDFLVFFHRLVGDGMDLAGTIQAMMDLQGL